MGIQPQFADPIQQYEKAMQIKSIIGQQALQAQQQQSNALDIQQKEQSVRDQSAMTQAMIDSKGDYTKVPDAVLSNGGSANAALSAYKSILDMRQTAGEIAKNDSITANNSADAIQKQHDQYRGQLLNIVATKDPAAQQTAWDQQITAEENAGTLQPGQMSHTYPGNDAATVFANHFAGGKQLIQEAQDRQKDISDAWKPLNGQLVNTLTGDKIGANLNVPQLNQALTTRYQVLNPGQPLPPQYTLQPGASPEDFARIDKIMQQSEAATATKSQQEQTNAIRNQTLDMARDKQDLNPVVGTDPKTGRTVLVPYSQAQQMGIQNPVRADSDMINKAMAARHWLILANQPGAPDAAPEDMGIMQLIDKLYAEGKLGPLAGRWNQFMAGTYGAGDPEYAALRAKMGLSTTLLMQAHVGSRGGSALLEHFEDLANAGKMDGATLKAAMGSEVNYVADKAADPSAANYPKPSTARSSASSGGSQFTRPKPNVVVEQ